MSITNSIDTIVNRTCDLPVCKAMPQPTAISRVEKQNHGEEWIKNGVGEAALAFL
jgi:hypothetical protein